MGCFLGWGQCVVSSYVDTIEGRVEGQGLKLCLKNVRAIHLCPDNPVLHHWPQPDTKHTNTHAQTHIGVVRSLVTDVCLCMSKSTCAHEHVCCVSILNGPSQRCERRSSK